MATYLIILQARASDSAPASSFAAYVENSQIQATLVQLTFCISEIPCHIRRGLVIESHFNADLTDMLASAKRPALSFSFNSACGTTLSLSIATNWPSKATVAA